MKQLIFIYLFLSTSAFSQNNLQKILELDWNTKNGLKSTLTNIANRGLKEYAFVDEDKVAIFSDSERKIKIFQTQTNKLISEFDIPFSVRRFTYDTVNDIFYFCD